MKRKTLDTSMDDTSLENDKTDDTVFTTKTDDTVFTAKTDDTVLDTAKTEQKHADQKEEEDEPEKDDSKQGSPKRQKRDDHKTRQENVFVALDFETTGTNIHHDEIIQVGLVKFDLDDGTVIEEYHTLVKPTKSIPLEAQNIHHLSDADVSDAPSFSQIVDRICEFIGPCGLVGHNLIKFDLPLLQSQLRRNKRKELDCNNRLLLDTFLIFQKKEPHTLEKAALFYCQDEEYDEKGAHDARNDARACVRILCGQKQRYPELFANLRNAENLCRPKEFFEVIHNDTRTDVILRFGKHSGKKASEVRKIDKGYWTWMINQEKTKRTKWYAILQSIT